MADKVIKGSETSAYYDSDISAVSEMKLVQLNKDGIKELTILKNYESQLVMSAKRGVDASIESFV